MNVIILAAGTGSRLGARTAAVPKAALVVAGRPLLAYDVAFARRAGAGRVAVVAGYRADTTGALARTLGADDVVVNPRWADAGNLCSLLAAARAGLVAGDCLVMNADHVYSPAIADVVAEAARGAAAITAFVDTDRRLGPDDMKVRRDRAGAVAAIAKGLLAWDAGYVGMTFLPAARLPSYLAAAETARRLLGDTIHVEAVLAELAATDPAATRDVSGHGWVEIDDEHDLARAEEFLAPRAWYSL